MREHSRDKGRLEDIVFYANNVKKILDGVSYDDFVNDIRIYYSVMKNIEIIGEAANMLSRDFIDTYTGLPWKQIIGMRPFFPLSLLSSKTKHTQLTRSFLELAKKSS